MIDSNINTLEKSKFAQTSDGSVAMRVMFITEEVEPTPLDENINTLEKAKFIEAVDGSTAVRVVSPDRTFSYSHIKSTESLRISEGQQMRVYQELDIDGDLTSYGETIIKDL